MNPAPTNDERLTWPTLPRSLDDATPEEWSAASRRLQAGSNGTSALDVQIAGNHYKKCGIQPIEYIHANNIPFAEGCAIKYLTRWRDKGGIKDLEKARHFIDLLIELESKAQK